MSKNRTRVPRASIAVTILDDADLIALCQSAAGRQALALFMLLVTTAKAQANDGRFTDGDDVIAALVRWPLKAFRHAVDTLINMPGRWVVREGDGLTIRSFCKWNGGFDGWGGPRSGAGRPQKVNKEEIKMNIQDESRGNQDDTQDDSRSCASVSLTDTLTPPPPSTSYEMRARGAPLPDGVGDGGGGGSLRGEAEAKAQAGVTTLPLGRETLGAERHPPIGAEASAHVKREIESAEAHRRESAMKALINAGVADPGTRDKLADMPLVTAGLVRRVQRDNPTLRGGGIANAVHTAAQQALFAQGGGTLVGGDGEAEQSNANACAVTSPRVERTEAMLAAGRIEASAARCEWAETLGVLQRHQPAEIEAAKEAVLSAEPMLRRTLGGEDPLRHRMLGTLVAERLDHEPSAPGSPKGIAAQQEAVTA